MNPIIAIICIFLLDYRAYSRGSLTPAGILTATATAIAHALHPWSIFFACLGVFFLAGTAVTKVKHEYKATLTTTTTASSKGATSAKAAPTPRTAVQVLCNSLPATVAILLHTYYLYTQPTSATQCLPHPPRIDQGQFDLARLNAFLPYAVLAHYAAAAADTFSSELGILASEEPMLVTSLLLSPRRVPRGTNGGVTGFGLFAGLMGGAVIGVLAVGLVPFCGSWTWSQRAILGIVIAFTGAMGSILDSLLGAWLQASVVEKGSGKVVENEGGGKVIVRKTKGGGKQEMIVTGQDWLSNNGVNLLMCSLMSLTGMGLAINVGDAYGR